MFAVITTVRLKAGRIDDVREMYKRIAPGLVAGDEDWVSASFTADRQDDAIALIAHWKSAEAYHRFAASDTYRTTMAQFERYFAHRPDVQVYEILVEL